MEIQVPLNKLHFGHEVGDGINARVSGRQEGIGALAANIFARGLIENLIVYHMFDDHYGVSNGNRRLAALHSIHGADNESVLINCTERKVNEVGAFEDSLTTAVLAAQLHPVDQYEAFARLKDAGNVEEEIAHRFGMSVRQVEQALALGHLSPAIRQAWRKGEIKAEAAQAFTMSGDHGRQDNALEELRQRLADIRYADAGDVKDVLDIARGGPGALVEFVGIDAYVARGGVVTRDFFGIDHQVSDPKLAEEMANERLTVECEKLVAAGWGFAIPYASVMKTAGSYGYMAKKDTATAEETARLDELQGIFNDPDDEYSDRPYADMSDAQREAYREHRQLKMAVTERSFSAKDKKKGGCFVDVDDDGLLDIIYGRSKPVAPKAAAATEREIAQSSGAAVTEAGGSTDASPAEKPEPNVISNALRDRMIAQLTHGTRDAVMACMDTDLIKSPIAQVLTKIVVSQINAEQPHHTPHSVMTKMHAIREAMPANLVNNAILKRFDAQDYFKSAPKSFVLKAIGEAINADEARKVASKTKAEIAKFAIANIGNKIGWVPKEMRCSHYVGPKPAPAATKATLAKKPAAKKAGADKAKPKPPKKAAAKKAVKKTAKKAAKR